MTHHWAKMEKDVKRRKITLNKSTSVVVVDNTDDTTIFNSEKTSSEPQDNLSNSSKSTSISYRLVPLNTSPNSSNITQSCSTSGQVLVMMPNNRDVLNQNVFIKRTEDPFAKTVIDQKRRMLHKEIERRRRNKINDWIYFLSKQVPDCASDRTKQGQSKGGILAKTSKYIQELRKENDKVNDILKEKDEIKKELERLRQQFINIEAENKRLASLLQEHDIPIIGNN